MLYYYYYYLTIQLDLYTFICTLAMYQTTSREEAARGKFLATLSLKT